MSSRLTTRETISGITHRTVGQFEGDLPKNTQLKIIGMGGAGLSVLGKLREKSIPGSLVLGIDYSFRRDLADRIPNKIALPQIRTRGLEDPGISHHRVVALSRVGAIAAMTFGAKRAILTLGLSGATGTGIAPIVASTLRALGTEVAIYAQMPFEFEGNRRRKEPLESITLLETLAHEFRVFHPDSLMQEYFGPCEWREHELTLAETFQLLSELMGKRIWQNSVHPGHEFHPYCRPKLTSTGPFRPAPVVDLTPHLAVPSSELDPPVRQHVLPLNLRPLRSSSSPCLITMTGCPAGTVISQGYNQFGRILMEVRAELASSTLGSRSGYRLRRPFRGP